MKWYPAVKCRDLFADQIEQEQQPGFEGKMFFTDEFDSTSNQWICPNVTEIKLWNDPVNYQQGLNFMMVVNSCENAQKIDKEEGLVSYADADGEVQCLTHD